MKNNNYKKIKTYSASSILKVLFFLISTSFFVPQIFSQKKSDKNKFEIFNENIAKGTSWLNKSAEYVRQGGPIRIDSIPYYIYLNDVDKIAQLTGLSIPIRENPGPGEYRYITFTWIKWGGNQIGLKLNHKKNDRGLGTKFNYTYVAGTVDENSPDKKLNGFLISESSPGNWTTITRDLWKDFGEFNMTGVSFLCPERRDAGFDGVFLGKNLDAFNGAPPVIPTGVTEAINVDDDSDLTLDSGTDENSQDEGMSVNVDWAAQIMAGGFMMYPLYLIGLIAVIIAVQRFMTAKEDRLAPKELREEVRKAIKNNNLDNAIIACDKYPSTLAEALRFIFKHKHAGMDVVSQTAGDIAARDIREHLNRIYPLSVIASLSPLLGLLGTIVGMIEAFALVAMYGDEGGAAILSDSISKALITTATGLIIAAPSVAVYFIIKKRIMRLASIIEVEVENTITELYLTEDNSK